MSMKNIFAPARMKNVLDQKGFTLVEMLVVVAIIAILASVFLVGLSGFRQSAYDARRLSDIQNVQTYLERFYNLNQSYPTSTSWYDLNTALQHAGILSGGQELPVDPAGGSMTSGGTKYAYCPSSDAQSYLIGVPLSDTAAAWSQSEAVPSNNFNGCSASCLNHTKPTPGSTNSLYCVVF